MSVCYCATATTMTTPQWWLQWWLHNDDRTVSWKAQWQQQFRGSNKAGDSTAVDQVQTCSYSIYCSSNCIVAAYHVHEIMFNTLLSLHTNLDKVITWEAWEGAKAFTGLWKVFRRCRRILARDKKGKGPRRRRKRGCDFPDVRLFDLNDQQMFEWGLLRLKTLRCTPFLRLLNCQSAHIQMTLSSLEAMRILIVGLSSRTRKSKGILPQGSNSHPKRSVAILNLPRKTASFGATLFQARGRRQAAQGEGALFLSWPFKFQSWETEVHELKSWEGAWL